MILETLELANLLIETILDKKGSEILLLDIREQAIFTDYFLIGNAENERQLQAMAEGVAYDAKHKGGIPANSIEGDPQSGWILVDFGDLIVHLFGPTQRTYYNLEELWSKAHRVLQVQ